MNTSNSLRMAQKLLWVLFGMAHYQRPRAFVMKGGRLRVQSGVHTAAACGITAESRSGPIGAVCAWMRIVDRDLKMGAAA